MKKLKTYTLFLIFFLIFSYAFAQTPVRQILVELGKKQLDISEPFTITVNIKNLDTTPKIIFPDIRGFQKRDQKVVRSEAKNDDGKKILTQQITQNYYAQTAGSFLLRPFVMMVEGQFVKSVGTTIEIVDDNSLPEDMIVEEVIADAFLGVFTNKKQVFVGEGFDLRLSFFVAESNTADLAFYKLETQLPAIINKIKPSNCWEENYNIKEIKESPITLAGKKYTEYRIFEAYYFPLNNNAIELPAVDLKVELKKDKDGKIDKQLQTFRSKPSTILVRALPKAIKQKQIAVGSYRLNERISKTGDSFEYVFEIEGDGNLVSAPEPTHEASNVFDVYPPKITQATSYLTGGLKTTKTYTYQLIPKQEGKFSLDKLFYWAYFDPTTARYDTLRSEANLSILDTNIQSSNTANTTTDPLGVYDGIENMDSSQLVTDYLAILKDIANILIIAMLVATLLLFRKR